MDPVFPPQWVSVLKTGGPGSKGGGDLQFKFNNKYSFGGTMF